MVMAALVVSLVGLSHAQNILDSGCQCIQVYDPVCGFHEGLLETFPNECEARCHEVENFQKGTCADVMDVSARQCICPGMYNPVCGRDGLTYSSECDADCAMVDLYQSGECPSNIKEILQFDRCEECTNRGRYFQEDKCFSNCKNNERWKNVPCNHKDKNPCVLHDAVGISSNGNSPESGTPGGSPGDEIEEHDTFDLNLEHGIRFDCRTEETWSPMKKLWCCRVMGQNCPAPGTPVPFGELTALMGISCNSMAFSQDVCNDHEYCQFTVTEPTTPDAPDTTPIPTTRERPTTPDVPDTPRDTTRGLPDTTPEPRLRRQSASSRTCEIKSMLLPPIEGCFVHSGQPESCKNTEGCMYLSARFLLGPNLRDHTNHEVGICVPEDDLDESSGDGDIAAVTTDVPTTFEMPPDFFSYAENAKCFTSRATRVDLQVNVALLHDCFDACRIEPECKFVTHMPNGRCLGYSACADNKLDTDDKEGFIVYGKILPTTTQGPDAFELFGEKKLCKKNQAQKLGRLRQNGHTLQACKDACESQAECTHISFHGRLGQCWMFKSCDKSLDKNAFDTWVLPSAPVDEVDEIEFEMQLFSENQFCKGTNAQKANPIGLEGRGHDENTCMEACLDEPECRFATHSLRGTCKFFKSCDSKNQNDQVRIFVKAEVGSDGPTTNEPTTPGPQIRFGEPWAKTTCPRSGLAADKGPNGGGHDVEDCKQQCKDSSTCNYMYVTRAGVCRFFEFCENPTEGWGDTYSVFRPN